MPQKKVVIVIAHTGYQPVEYAEPKRILAEAGYHITTASNKPGKATAKDGSSAVVDVTIDDLNIQDYAALLLIGGPGALDNLDTEQVYELVRLAFADEKIIGAICVVPRILAHAGILTQLRATGWDEDNQLTALFKEHDVHYVKEPVVVDEGIVTAQGPQAATDFGVEILALLKALR